MTAAIGGLLSGMIRRGFEVAVTSGDGAGLADTPLRATGVSVYGSTEVELDRFDLVHIHGWDYPGGKRVARAARSAGKPYVIAPHGAFAAGRHDHRSLRERVAWHWRDRRLVRGAAFLAAVNECDQAELIESRIHSDVRILSYGVDFAQYAAGRSMAEGRAPDSGRRLLVLGPVDPTSGCIALLKALAEVGPAADGWRVILAGPCQPTWRKALEAAIRRKSAEARVTWAAAADLAAQQELLAAADLLVSPGPRVRPPVAVVQAIAARVPVVSTHCTAPPGMDSTIRICLPGRAELREALRAALQVPEDRRKQEAELAQARGAAVLDWSVLVERYVAEYASIL